MNCANLFPVAVLLLAAGFGEQGLAGEASSVALGMREQEVVSILGQPERKAILQGKLLIDIKGGTMPSNRPNAMIVFLYERDKVRVWFRRGKVTDVTRDGVSVHR